MSYIGAYVFAECRVLSVSFVICFSVVVSAFINCFLEKNMGLVKYAIWDERDDRHFLMLVDMLFVVVNECLLS